ncbi:MAG: IS630 family transposase, partial [Candidatus Bathyarchaeota archaeon]
MKRKIPNISETLDELNTNVNKERNPAVKRRIHMLLLIKSNEVSTRKELANRIKVHRNTIGNWLSIYQAGGFDELLKMKTPGPPPGQHSLPENVLTALKERLEEPSGFSSYLELHTWLEKNYGIKIKYRTLHQIIRYRLKAKPKVPRKSHVKKDEVQQAEFRDSLSDQLKELVEKASLIDHSLAENLTANPLENTETTNVAADTHNNCATQDAQVSPTQDRPKTSGIRVFAQDESRFGLMPVTRRRITAYGTKPIQLVQFQFESYYIYGAVEPLTGENFFLEMPFLNSGCFQVFLNEFSHFYKNEFNILLLDNSSTHKASSLFIPDNIALLFLPPYSPELNPIERLWQYIKSKISLSLFESLEVLKQNVAEKLSKCT